MLFCFAFSLSEKQQCVWGTGEQKWIFTSVGAVGNKYSAKNVTLIFMGKKKKHQTTKTTTKKNHVGSPLTPKSSKCQKIVE